MSEVREKIIIYGSQGVMLYDSDEQGKVDDAVFQAEFFTPEYWKQQPSTEVLAQGRSTTYKVQVSETHTPWVLRQYYRGGLFGRLIERDYWFAAEDKVRSFAEWRLLKKLYDLGLSVPKPIAAIYWRKRFTYRAALLTEFIPNSVTLSHLLASNQEVNWSLIAQTIRAIHRAGCVHGDLNAHNILLHADKATIIDFDKSFLLSENGTTVQAKNLFRLKRSILKITNWPEAQLETQWNEFMQAYTSA